MILNCRSCLIKKYLSKELCIIEQDTKQLSLLSIHLQLRINLIEQPKTDYVMVKNEAIYALTNIIKQFHIQKIYGYDI